MKCIDVHPGFNKSILEALQLKVQAMSAQDRIVAVSFDEMAIRGGLMYDEGRDEVDGFADGISKSKELANHALVLMVRGLYSKWKQPVGYFLGSGPMTGQDLKMLLLECIDKLTNIGLTVIICVCDQGSNNQNLFATQLGSSETKPFFMHNSRKVFTLFDPPHLLKNVRNNLKKHGFMLGETEILWDHVVAFYEADSSKPIRMAPKLTKTHITLPPFKPLRVCLAAHVLSHTVATGMALMSQWNIIPGWY